MSVPAMPAEQRILRKIHKAPSGCWEWTGTLQPNGYAAVRYQGRTTMAHRLSYETFVGPIPDGYQIDHLCRNIKCVNPAHLEAVTPRVNTLRSTSFSALNAVKDECKNGHPFTEANTYRWGNDGRSRPARLCRQCRAAAESRRRARVRAAIVISALGLLAIASPAFADHGQEADGCTHGATSKPCRPDPQPTNGKDCEIHGNHGGYSEDHCSPSPTVIPTTGTPSPTTTGGTPSTTTTSGTSTVSPSTSTTSVPTTSVPSSPSSTTSPPTSTASQPVPSGTSPSTETTTPTSPATSMPSPKPSRPASSGSTTSAPSVPSATPNAPDSLAYTGLNALLAAAGIALLACGAYVLDVRRRMGGRH